MNKVWFGYIAVWLVWILVSTIQIRGLKYQKLLVFGPFALCLESVDPDGNQTIFYSVLLDPVSNLAKLWERTWYQISDLKKPDLVKVKVRQMTVKLELMASRFDQIIIEFWQMKQTYKQKANKFE